MISCDGDNVVFYSKYEDRLTVTKGLNTSYEDLQEFYTNEIHYQTLLSEFDIAPKILKKDIKEDNFMYWISEDAGLPIKDCDISDANRLLDIVYDMGIIINWRPHISQFVKGFDDKIRIVDFKHTEKYDEPIGKHNRKYLSIT